MSKPLISVVTPVRNGSLYLRECIESVLSQSFQDWEYVIVNNDSSDDTRTIAEEYAGQDRRIRLVDTPGSLPMLANWNYALHQISPDSAFCKVVHADDYMFPECLERMSRLAGRDSRIGLVTAARRTELGIDLVTDIEGGDECIFDGRTVGRFYLAGGTYLFGSPSNCLMRSSHLRARRAFYNEGNFHADAEACVRLLASADLGYIAEPLTFTRHHSESATAKSSSRMTSTVHQFHLITRYGEIFLDEPLLTHMRRFRRRKLYSAAMVDLLERGPSALTTYERSLAALGYKFRQSRLIGSLPFVVVGNRPPRSARRLGLQLEPRLLT